MRILALALGVPFPPLGGGLTRTFQLLKALARDHEVTLAAFEYGEPREPAPYRVRVEPVAWEWSSAYQEMVGADAAAATRAYEHLTYQHPEPWFASVLDPSAMERALHRLIGERPDIVLLEGTPLARFLPMIPPHVPCVLDLFDIHSVIAQRAVDAASPEDAAVVRERDRTLAFERAAAQRCVACLAVSERDADLARTLLHAASVHLVPNGVDTGYFTPSPEATEPGALLLTGRMSYEPNADAAAFFAEQILPRIRHEAPHAHFHVVGAAPPPHVRALASDAVTIHGQVDDVRPYLRRCEVVVVPIRNGGGTRLKVLEAAASGKAIVSTPRGVEGLAFEHGRDLLVAETPAAFAAAVLSLLRDASRRDALARQARSVSCRYDWLTIGEHLQAILASSLLRRR